jgi:hypothetical protein
VIETGFTILPFNRRITRDFIFFDCGALSAFGAICFNAKLWTRRKIITGGRQAFRALRYERMCHAPAAVALKKLGHER